MSIVVADPDRFWLAIALFVAGSGAAALLIGLSAATLRAYRRQFAPRLNRGLSEASHGVDADRLLRGCFIGAMLIAVGVGLLSGSFVLALVVAIGAASAPLFVVRWMRQLRRLKFRSQLPDLMMLMAGALRGGAGLGLAFSRVAGSVASPASRELERVIQATRMGSPLAQALAQLERRMPFEEVTLWVTALRIGAESGAGMAAVLESLSETMRRKLALERKILALTAQGRLQAWVMSALPLVVLVLLRWVDHESFSQLVDTADGRLVLAAVALGQVVGFIQIRRIVAIEV
jgi:tight adherence protein B